MGVFGTRSDLGLVLEYMYDDRGNDAFNTLFENDVALGARWVANDLADTEALVGYIWDVDSHEYVFSLEASRRLGDSWKLNIEARYYQDQPPTDPLYAFRDDDFIEVELAYYF